MNGIAARRRLNPTHMAVLAGLCACAGPQSTLDPKGPVAEDIAAIWWLMACGAAVVLTLVMGLVWYAVYRDPDRRPRLAPVPFMLGAGVGLPLVLLVLLLVQGTSLGRRITESAAEPLRIEVTGHRWWWEVRYPGDQGPQVLTANELRLPVGMPVEITLRSADVIHSFWIPNLGGKIDMIPGIANTLRLTASVPGRFRAQCSEFCGSQHARMGFIAVAEPEDEFRSWRARRAAQPAPQGEGLARFLDLGCGSCHALAGTDAQGGTGPVLTHLEDRPTIGAGASRNSGEALRAWLVDHGRTLKPGSAGPDRRRLADEDVDLLAQLLGQP